MVHVYLGFDHMADQATNGTCYHGTIWYSVLVPVRIVVEIRAADIAVKLEP